MAHSPPRGGVLTFVGVSTSGSRIMDVFPTWAGILGLDAAIEGRDIALAADATAYRDAVREIAEDPDVAGALVTSHKVEVYRYAADLFRNLDPYARLCREISCISKRDGGLAGHAKDPITAGRTVHEMLGDGFWAEREREVLCLGAGGAGTAITVRLLSEDRPLRRLVVADHDPAAIERLAAICRDLDHGTAELRTVATASEAGGLLADLSPGSFVVNATGMGKDVPGSPITDEAVFPLDAAVWDLNYRGDLRFLGQARAQAAERRLAIHDGWAYFLHGWSEVIAEVYGVSLTPKVFSRLARAAEPLRPISP